MHYLDFIMSFTALSSIQLLSIRHRMSQGYYQALVMGLNQQLAKPRVKDYSAHRKMDQTRRVY